MGLSEQIVGRDVGGEHIGVYVVFQTFDTDQCQVDGFLRQGGLQCGEPL